MEKLFTLEIVTPERSFFKGEVEAVVLETPTGQREVMKHTLPTVFILSGGVMRIKQNARWMEAFAGEGFVRVGARDTVIMAETCEWPYEIDADKVSEEIERLDEAMKKSQSMREYKMAKVQLAVQLARLNAKKRGD